MAVTDYLQKSSGTCGYSYNKLKNVIYLVSEEHIKDIIIDNGEAYISGLTESPLCINGFNIQFNEETSLDERYKFQKTLTLSMHGYVNYKVFQGCYYAIIESMDGTFFMINVDFPSRITHTFNLSKDTNQTDFTFASLSNFPTLKLNAEFDAVEPVCFGMMVHGINALELLEKGKAVLDISNEKVISTEDFKKVEYLGDSCTYQEVYDGFKVTDTITFNIGLDNYKPSWQWNLLEFLKNRYIAIITPKGDNNRYYSGFNFGLEPSYVIQTSSQNGQSDIITVTLVESSIYGSTAGELSDEKDDDKEWRFVKYVGEIKTWICASMGTGEYLVKEEVDMLGNPTGRYMVLEGYEQYFENLLNIIGTFDETEYFSEPECSRRAPGMCYITSDIPSTIIFNSVTCNTYNVKSSCDWEITNIPSHLTVSPTSGEADNDYSVTICNTLTPTSNPVENYLQLISEDDIQIINVKVIQDNSCLRPSTKQINCLGQTVTFTYNGSCQINVTSIDPSLTYQVGYNTLTVQVPRNYGTSAITWNITYTNCNCSPNSETVSIIQDKQYERWVEDSGYICDSGNSYHIEVKYTGTTADNINTRTSITRKGSLIQSGDTRCGSETKWEWDNESYTCVDGNKYKVEFEYISTDGGQTWTKTSNTRVGELVEEQSEYCQEPVEYKWVLTTNWVCESTPPTPTFDGKFKATYSGGTTYSAECDSNTTLTTADTKPSGYDYTEMTSAIIGDCITSIGTAFQYCSSLSSVTIPNSVTSIGEFAFNYCTSLTDITIPSGVTSIANNTFYNCHSLQSIVMSDNITSIGNSAFNGCENLTSITIPSGVTSIGNSAFKNCAITSIEIPNSVTSIGNDVFSWCSSLSSITVNATTPPTLGSSAFAYTNSAPIYVPCSSVETYKSASGWSNYASRIQGIPPCGGPTPTFDGKFKATYSGGTTYSAECDSSSALTSGETQPSGYQYTAMTDAVIGLCVNQLAPMTFYNYRKLSGVTIPDTVTIIGNSAFASCKSLSSITIPNSVTSINFNAFGDCSALSSITIPNSVTTIGDAAFIRCSGLTSCTIGSGVTSIGYGFLHGCTSITNVDIPDSVTTISSGLCSGCTSMLNITIGSGVTSIGQEALFRCTGLNSITCKAVNPPTMGDTYAFRSTNNCPIYVPSGSVNTYKSAPSWSDCAARITAIPNS